MLKRRRILDMCVKNKLGRVTFIEPNKKLLVQKKKSLCDEQIEKAVLQIWKFLKFGKKPCITFHVTKLRWKFKISKVFKQNLIFNHPLVRSFNYSFLPVQINSEICLFIERWTTRTMNDSMLQNDRLLLMQEKNE